MRTLAVFIAAGAFSYPVIGQDLAIKTRQLPLIQSEQLRHVIIPSNLVEKAYILEDFANASPQRDRAIFSSGHKATYEWIYDSIKNLSDYYNVEYQEFLIEGSNSTMFVNGTFYNSAPAFLSPDGNVSGFIVPIPNFGCEVADYSGLDLVGKVALAEGGICGPATKILLARDQGAVAIIIYFDDWTASLGGRANPNWIPNIQIERADGLALIEATKIAPVSVTIDINFGFWPTYNVIAQTKGGDQNNVLLVGAHTDTVRGTPGISDNGSGAITLLEIAKQVSSFSTKNALRFGWWSAEETNLMGSTMYVNSLSTEEIAKVALYLNFDMIASPNYVYGIYDGDGSTFNTSSPPGSAAAEKLFQDFFTNELNLPHTPRAFNGRSDYRAFAAAGVPVGGLFTGAEVLKTPEEAAKFGGEAGVPYDVNYHGVGDKVANLNVTAWLQNTFAVAHAVATYCVSFDSLGTGRREERTQNRAEWIRQVAAEND